MGRKLLLVEDNKTTRNAVSYLLKREGFDVISVTDGTEAVDRFTSEHFDVVLADFAMPGMDGLTLTGQIHAVAPDTPVLIMSGHSKMNQQRVLDAGAVDFIEKPILIDVLIAKIKTVFAAEH